jgi:hypothetical protein
VGLSNSSRPPPGLASTRPAPRDAEIVAVTLIRPIYHHTEERVRAHLLLCMLAYYVKWHLGEAWRSLLFADEDQARLAERDLVAPATRSAAALAKVASKRHSI